MALHLLVQPDAVVENEELPAPTPLLHPSAGLPAVIDTEAALTDAIADLARGSGPFALDAERASGYKYSARAYLIQLKRKGGGLHLIDPIPFGPGHPLLAQLNQLLQGRSHLACKYARSSMSARTWN